MLAFGIVFICCLLIFWTSIRARPTMLSPMLVFFNYSIRKASIVFMPIFKTLLLTSAFIRVLLLVLTRANFRLILSGNINFAKFFCNTMLNCFFNYLSLLNLATCFFMCCSLALVLVAKILLASLIFFLVLLLIAKHIAI